MEKLQSSKNAVKWDDCSSDFQSMIKDAFQSIASRSTTEKHEMKRFVVQELLSFLVGADELNDKELMMFADFLVDEIERKAKVLNGKETTISFSHGILRISLVLYLRSKKGYEEQRKLSPFILPTTRQFGRIQSEKKVNESFNPVIYGWFADEYVNQKIKSEKKKVVPANQSGSKKRGKL
mmetsp:Transcript_25655/g.42700  ORF Transcript_25655/g.42700 Transcript_25655/m.42700 type:complete len:180 (-) Transcript_25655:75-614(-)|eukprot:CAMPEP_0119009204 /NCGR_PEP_ID=MMETSP1176-20130426/4209_1 /TAXON_ID=265551 /ORGANISM="Synedropsis recta cf, Strain CCMP1620" /LENGTH=179 /DNA_ID=CAMNT_0006961671 /DNA_START=727 /DNA_END=1266 /DNA_ORIENTATION=+